MKLPVAQVTGPRPFFLDGTAGRLFAVAREPEGRDRDLAVVIVPPFAEEMNRSRRMFTLLMQDLARTGVGSLLIDLHGTGDSGGAFGDARWTIWLDDVAVAVRHLKDDGWSRITLLGLRMGALLAAEAAPAGAGLVLWQPVTSGEAMLTQFLRLRLAGDMAVGGGTKTTTRDLRANLAQGESLEIAGYELHPDLAAAIDSRRLAAVVPKPGVSVHWLDVAAEPGDSLSPASAPVIAAWAAAGCTPAQGVVQGLPFWTLQETAVAPALVAETTRRLLLGAP